MYKELTQEILDRALELGKGFTSCGKVASYIPELAKANRDNFGICVVQSNGEVLTAGDTDVRFSIQSVCKTILLALALTEVGEEEVFNYVLMEPSGDSFNSILKLDIASNKPYNPFINAGAIQVTGLLAQHNISFEQIITFARKLCQDEEISLNEAVYNSESTTGDRNRAIAYLLKSKQVMHAEPALVTDNYFRACSMNVTAKSLANWAMVLANGGCNPKTGERYLDAEHVRIINTLMFTCGMYDGSGSFAVKVGMPGKSGVGGGIITTAKNRMGVGVYGPSLDEKGNSIAGINALEYLSRELELHVFEY